MSTRKLHKSKRSKRYYGLTQVKRGQKYCWLSRQNKNGWSLGLALNNRTVWLRNIRFKTHKDVKYAMENVSVQMVPLKDSK